MAVSGGARQFSEPGPAPSLGRLAGFRAVKLDASGPGMRPVSPCEDFFYAAAGFPAV